MNNLTYLALIIYPLSIFIGYQLDKLYNNKVSNYFLDNLYQWSSAYTLGFLLFIICVIFQSSIFFESIIIWLIALFVMPFISLSIESKEHNIISSLTFLIAVSLTIGLMYNLDKTRDFIGQTFISDYRVEYDYVPVHDEIKKIIYINTDNKNLDYILRDVFPIVYNLFTISLLIISFLLNIMIANRKELLKMKT